LQSGTATSVSYPPIQWITIGKVQPVSYYLTLLQSNGTQPYVQLAQELQKLPDDSNSTAVAQITFLALNATNPEVKEAFQLMMKGGTPNDFMYTAPSYNTELQVLYWLACQNEFKKDDTLALAVSMANGLWVAMGDDEVRQAVYNNSAAMLRFGRETSQWQRESGLPYDLENYPLEAKICWAWTANSIIVEGGKDVPHAPLAQFINGIRLNLKSYQWFTVSVSTLTKMREIVSEKWLNASVGVVIANLEYYFYFNAVPPGGDNGSTNWIYTSGNDTMVIDGEQVLNHNYYNVNWLFGHYLETGTGIGNCGDEAALVDALAKSVGIATDARIWHGSGYGHSHVTYFDPQTGMWQVYSKQSQMALKYVKGQNSDVFLLRMPVDLAHYFKRDSKSGWITLVSVTNQPNSEQLAIIYEQGLTTQTMKQLLLYY
jgi:hypothetical protein